MQGNTVPSLTDTDLMNVDNDLGLIRHSILYLCRTWGGWEGCQSKNSTRKLVKVKTVYLKLQNPNNLHSTVPKTTNSNNKEC